jgi:hypothetical protein
MKKRQSLSKKTRFEVFKRDKFTCQYCGATAPGAILHVDHIKPVAKGGTNDVFNLVTACESCNSGKGARKLDDDSAITRQHAQLAEFEERRQQLDLLIEWQESLENFEEQEIDAVADKFQEMTAFEVNETGRKKVRQWIKKHGVADVLSALKTSVDQYVTGEPGEEETARQVLKAFGYIPRILAVRKRDVGKPHMQDLYYVRGILRNRLRYVNERMVMPLLEGAYDSGVDTDVLKDIAKEVSSWTQFREAVDWLVNDAGEE